MVIRIGSKILTGENRNVGIGFDKPVATPIKPVSKTTPVKERTTPEGYIRRGCFILKDKRQEQSNNIVTDSHEKSLLKLPLDWDKIATDGEYYAQTDKRTDPLCISLWSAENFKAYLHPASSLVKDRELLAFAQDQLESVGEKPLKVFESPNVLLDFLQDVYQIKWRPIQDLKRHRVKTIKLYFFFSFKDLEFLWAKSLDYLYYCLQFLERIRRITTKFNKSIPLPYEIRIPMGNKMQWVTLSLELVDICAMQGSKSLKTYLQNVGLSGDTKKLWDWSENNNPIDFLLEKPKEFMEYIRGDVDKLVSCHDKTIDFYNQIAEMVGVEASQDWGMSTGKITARIVSEWLAKQEHVNVPTKNDKNKNQHSLYWYNRLASPEAIKQLSHLTGNQKLLYLGMTDGGRCVKERSKIDVLEGILVDIDIAGCYGNGLKNQIFPIGNPSIISTPMKFKDWEEEYSKYLIPGLWVARISWKDAPFRQDLLLSKIEKAFTAWEWYQSHFAEHNSDSDKQYDASMYMSTNEVTTAALNHDLLQVILKYSSVKIELPWIRENAVIDCFAYYDKRDEVDKVIPEMTEIKSLKDLYTSGLCWSTKWVRVELKDLVGVLLDKRETFKKKIKLYNKHFGKDNKITVLEDIPKLKKIKDIEFSKTDFLYHNSIQEFIKLIVNTIYGCIASAYFACDGTGISNYIIGNNITARARTLSWCMAKGLYSLMSITDGGVFDVNRVAFYLRKSINNFAELGFENYKCKDRTDFVEIKPLYGKEIKLENMFDILNDQKHIHVQLLAWKHLKNIFGELDIFKFDQYSFEVKQLYTLCELRNKSDYNLSNSVNGVSIIKIRGLSQKKAKDGDDVASSIFEAISNNQAGVHEIVTTRLLGLSEWREMNSEEQKRLLPHDEVSDKKKFFTLTPLGCKFINSSHHNDVNRIYTELKQTNQSELIAKLREMEEVSSVEEYELLRKKFRSEAKEAREAMKQAKAKKADLN